MGTFQSSVTPVLFLSDSVIVIVLAFGSPPLANALSSEIIIFLAYWQGGIEEWASDLYFH